MRLQLTWIQRLVVVVVGCNSVLIVYGIHVVPSTLTSANGVGALFGALGMQLSLAALAPAGPWSLQRSRSSRDINCALVEDRAPG